MLDPKQLHTSDHPHLALPRTDLVQARGVTGKLWNNLGNQSHLGATQHLLQLQLLTPPSSGWAMRTQAVAQDPTRGRGQEAQSRDLN